MEQDWKSIPGFEGLYEVSKGLLQVRSVPKSIYICRARRGKLDKPHYRHYAGKIIKPRKQRDPSHAPVYHLHKPDGKGHQFDFYYSILELIEMAYNINLKEK